MLTKYGAFIKLRTGDIIFASYKPPNNNFSNSRAFPHVLTALSQAVAKETKPSALDNICGAIARLIITNSALVPLEQVLPVFLMKLPLREDFDENAAIFKCFKLLYIQARECIVDAMEQILAITIQVLYKKEYVDQETADNALGLLKEIRENYPAKFNAVATSSAEVAAFLQTIWFYITLNEKGINEM